MKMHYKNIKEFLKTVKDEIRDPEVREAVAALVECERISSYICESANIQFLDQENCNHVACNTQENEYQSVENFFQSCYEDGLFDQEKVPIAVLYYAYCKDCGVRRNDESAVSLRSFTQTLQSIIQEYPLRLSKKRSVVSTIKLRSCNLREFFDGKDLYSFSKENDEWNVLKQKTTSIINPNPTSFLYRYSLNHTDKQLTQLMIELANKENCDVQQIYAMSQQELERLYNRHKDQLSEHLARFNQ